MVVKNEQRLVTVEQGYGDRLTSLEKAQATLKKEAVDAAKTAAAQVVPTGGRSNHDEASERFVPTNFAIK